MLRASMEKDQVKYKRWAIRVTPDFSMKTLKPRRAWIDIVQTLSHRCEVRLLYPAKLSRKIEEKENHSTHTKKKINKYHTTNVAQEKILRKKIQYKEINQEIIILKFTMKRELTN